MIYYNINCMIFFQSLLDSRQNYEKPFDIKQEEWNKNIPIFIKKYRFSPVLFRKDNNKITRKKEIKSKTGK